MLAAWVAVRYKYSWLLCRAKRSVTMSSTLLSSSPYASLIIIIGFCFVYKYPDERRFIFSLFNL